MLISAKTVRYRLGPHAMPLIRNLWYSVHFAHRPELKKTNAQIAKELKITPILDKSLEYKRNWIQHVNRMPRNRLPKVMKHYSPTSRRNHGRPLKRILDMWDRNGSTSGPTPWQTYDDDDDAKAIEHTQVSCMCSVFILITERQTLSGAGCGSPLPEP